MNIKLNSGMTKLRECIAIQSQPGNWDYDDYMRGMLNGMILSETLFTGKDPVYFNKPKEGYGTNEKFRSVGADKVTLGHNKSPSSPENDGPDRPKGSTEN